MPGKVNPVIAESVTMVCAQVMGNHTVITVCGQSGNFELNVMLPVAAYALLQSVELLANSCTNFARQCVNGLVATPKGPEMVSKGLMTCTNLVPFIGYDAAAKIAKKAAATGRTIAEASALLLRCCACSARAAHLTQTAARSQVAVEDTKLSAAELAKILDPVTMVEPAPRAKL
jgi:fumarate hydratase class II